jgi:hypothetical protein
VALLKHAITLTTILNDGNKIMTLTRFLRVALLATFSVLLAACAKDNMKPESADMAEKPMVQAQEEMIGELYEAHHDGRIYVFYDRGLYEGFKKTGHTAYMMARIGGGPKGETIKFALTGKDKKKREGIISVDLFDGKLKASETFYGEVYAEGRIYVFDSYAGMENFRKIGEAPLRYTEIGSGPKGETVVYVLNSNNKKKKPVAMIEAFKKMNG